MPTKHRIGMMLMTLGLLMGFTGCDDPKQRIAQLEEENRGLLAERDRLQQEMAQIRRDREQCLADLLAMQQTVDGLNSELTDLRNKPQLPGDWKPTPGGATMTIDGQVLFDPGKVELKESAKSVLNKVASEISGTFSDKDIYIVGHTDTDPIKHSSWKDNRELSAERAMAVCRYLATQGVPAARLVACGWGEHKPVASNGSSDGKAKNRRVEFYAADPSLWASK
ncbi:MAG: hypothetical protein HJJLKODD_00740 [Phycisphaerae bacterium]|nr:hypothetical protein [Phycisphaerae bacterium]